MILAPKRGILRNNGHDSGKSLHGCGKRNEEDMSDTPDNGGATPEDQMRYDLLAEFALRQVVRMALQRVQRTGLPGEHHFYIAFDTRHPGVRLSDRLRQKYPEEMTIVLQHQFWDLKVLPDRFEVGLAFGGVPEKLVIPFEAVKGFFDPHAQFALQFRDTTQEEQALLRQSEPGDVPPAAFTGGQGQAEKTTLADDDSAARPTDEAASAEESEKPGKSEKVVSLDAFRKKT